MIIKRIAAKVLLSVVAAAAVAVYGSAETAPVATAKIPFEFFVDGERMPTGDYTISSSDNGTLLLYNKATGATKHTYVARSGDPVAVKNAMLVFVLFKQQYRLVAFRGLGGTWRITEYIFSNLPEGASLHEIPMKFLAGDQ